MSDHQTDSTDRPLLICFSHLRWDFVFQRPQHLMRRLAARNTASIFWEEPHRAGAAPRPRWTSRTAARPA